MAAAVAEQHHLPHDEFFTRLTSLFESHRPHETDSIYLTQKRFAPDSTVSEEQDDLNPSTSLPVLIRATNGKSQRASSAAASSTSRASKPTKKGTTAAAAGATGRKNGKEGKVKISTVVQPDELDAFFARYAECAKLGMAAGLKKRDRRANRKRKDKDKKKKTTTSTSTAAAGATSST